MISVVKDNTVTIPIEKKVSIREREILEMISEGRTVKEIASTLYLSEHTIISHKKNLTVKLNAKNAVHLIVRAIRLGLVKL